MARNEEKAMAMLNRWTAQKRDLEMATNMGKSTYMGGALPPSASYGPFAQKKRPKIANEVSSLKECEHWRGEILRGVAKKIAEIQNAALGEHRIRDLNDEINKDLREKGYWEDQIKSLGGADYKANRPKEVETYGAELASHSGYKYFGAAKDLPGVRELFETEAVPEAPRKTRKQLFKNIQPDYYGWRDEEDGMLLLAEQEVELEAVKKEVARWQAEQASKPAKKRQKTEGAAPATSAVAEGAVADAAVEGRRQPAAAAAAPVEGRDSNKDWKAYVDVPTMEDIEKLIIQKKKQALLNRYTTSEERSRLTESSDLLTAQKKEEGDPQAADAK
jgi:pre-mRNA-splicing factor ISY1